jgi:serine/threonine-protein kinase
VSTGEDESDQIVVPDLTGMTPNEARDLLRGQGWTGNFNQQGGKTDDVSQLGKITDQEVGANQKIDRDQNFGITVATTLDTGGGR